MSGCPHARLVAAPGHFVAVMLVAGGLSAGVPAAWPATPARAAAAGSSPAPPLVVTTERSHVDYQTDTATFEHISVSQGETRVTAERARASGLEFKNSTWVFEGDVEVFVRPNGTIRSDRAVVQVRDSRVTEATITGKPAVFEEQRTGARSPVRGEADNIVYNAREDTVRLSGEAWLSTGQDERISGPLLTYDIRGERLEAISPGGVTGVHITVNPQPRGRSPSRRSPGKPSRAPAGPP